MGMTMKPKIKMPQQFQVVILAAGDNERVVQAQRADVDARASAGAAIYAACPAGRLI